MVAPWGARDHDVDAKLGGYDVPKNVSFFFYFVFDLPYIKVKEFYANVVLFIEVSLLISGKVFL